MRTRSWCRNVLILFITPLDGALLVVSAAHTAGIANFVGAVSLPLLHTVDFSCAGTCQIYSTTRLCRALFVPAARTTA